MSQPENQSLDPQLIDSIVREVLARLQANSQPTATRVAAPQGDAPATAELVLVDRVVSLATLKDRLSGQTTLVLVPGAILTPAARDLVKQHKLTIRHAGQSAAAGSAVVQPIAW